MRKVSLLFNPLAGKGKALSVADEIQSLLKELDVETEALIPTDRSQVEGVIKESVDSGIDTLIAVGGDGLINQAVNVLAETDVVLGVIAYTISAPDAANSRADPSARAAHTGCRGGTDSAVAKRKISVNMRDRQASNTTSAPGPTDWTRLTLLASHGRCDHPSAHAWAGGREAQSSREHAHQ